MAETDNPWKEALDDLPHLAMAFFLLDEARAYDWTRDHETLETELRPFAPASQTGLKYVDKLVKLWRSRTPEGEILEAGTQEEDYYHFEVQYRREAGFEKRMSDYNDVARVHLRNHVVSVAILCDEEPTWRPEVYHWERNGCSVTFRFRVVKLLDWSGREEELLEHDNPFALFVLAHLLIEPTANDEEARAGAKLRLWQKACEHKMELQDRATLMRLIDWMLLLPQQRNRLLIEQFTLWRDKPMPFVSIFEQVIHEKEQTIQARDQAIQARDQTIRAKDQTIQAKDQTIHEKEQTIQAKEQQLRDRCLRGIALGLKLKFQTAGEALFAEIRDQTDLELLGRFLDAIEPAATLGELRKLLP